MLKIWSGMKSSLVVLIQMSSLSIGYLFCLLIFGKNNWQFIYIVLILL